MGPPLEVAEAVEVLRSCAGLTVNSASPPVPTRYSNEGARWVRVYLTATVGARQTGPCHAAADALWIGQAHGPDGPVNVWGCGECGGQWTVRPRDVEVTR